VSGSGKDEKPIDLLVKQYNTVPLSFIATQLPEACGCEYKFQETNILRVL